MVSIPDPARDGENMTLPKLSTEESEAGFPLATLVDYAGGNCDLHLSGINGQDFIAAESERAIKEVLGGDAMILLPLLSPNGPVGVLAIRHQDAAQLRMPEYRMILENYSTQIAMALERDRLMLESQTARVEVETEQLRNTLLSSVSHDLRTPLAVISGATSSILRNPGMNTSTQRELLQTVFDESDRLSLYAGGYAH